ncbi:hypothetical protein Unana1_01375 [Umbelopsis nana]
MTDSEDVMTETQYILLELGENVPEDILIGTEASGGYSLIGLNTPTPFLQLGPEIYQGYYDETIGSNLLLEKVPNTDDTDANDEFDLLFAGATTKTITFHKVNLTKKEEKKEEEPKAEEEPAPSFINWVK